MLSLGREVLPISRDQGSPVNVATALDPLAWAIHVGGDPARATRLLAAADGIREGLGLRLRVGADRARVEAELLALRSALGEEAFAVAWAAGQALTVEQAVAEALQAIDEAQQESGTLL